MALAYKVYRCWVSEFQALADLDANANAVNIQHLKLENEGWERDADTPEPTDPRLRAERRQRAMQPLSAASLLDLWELARTSTLPHRALAVLAAANPDTPYRDLAALPVGEREWPPARHTRTGVRV